ncbi:MAG: pentapeptide repeat-containing protein, partial [Moheibacter sp.]
FSNCKLLGLNFNDCNEFSLSFTFTDCQLNHASFFKLKIKKIFFSNCKMMACDFIETDLTESVFENCDLQDTQFEYTQLEKVDFRSSYNLSFDPERNKLKNTHFSKENAIGLLSKYNIKID